MYKIYKIIIFICLFFVFNEESKAHVTHYKDLKKIEFDIYRNNKHIGEHTFLFKKINDMTFVESKIKFEIKKLGIVLYRYNVEGTEVYKDQKLIKFNSKTNQNGKEKFVNLETDKEEHVIEGSSFKGKVPIDYLIGTWWNHSLVEASAQISAVSGRIIKQKVTFLGNEVIDVNNKKYKTLHFNFSSTDASLAKNKKLNTDIWYEENSLNWIKATFKKSGNWEYRLKLVK
tara:strand:+ start:86 stop:772 length:687 start_codon:yes stop_codon:yes gene_type:complete